MGSKRKPVLRTPDLKVVSNNLRVKKIVEGSVVSEFNTHQTSSREDPL